MQTHDNYTSPIVCLWGMMTVRSKETTLCPFIRMPLNAVDRSLNRLDVWLHCAPCRFHIREITDIRIILFSLRTMRLSISLGIEMAFCEIELNFPSVYVYELYRLRFWTETFSRLMLVLIEVVAVECGQKGYASMRMLPHTNIQNRKKRIRIDTSFQSS